MSDHGACDLCGLDVGVRPFTLNTAEKQYRFWCERCMVSVWGTPAILLLGFRPDWYLLPVYWLAATGLQEMFDR